MSYSSWLPDGIRSYGRELRAASGGTGCGLMTMATGASGGAILSKLYSRLHQRVPVKLINKLFIAKCSRLFSYHRIGYLNLL